MKAPARPAQDQVSGVDADALWRFAYRFARGPYLLTIAGDMQTFRLSDESKGTSLEFVRGTPLPDDILMFNFWLLRTLSGVAKRANVAQDPALLEMVQEIQKGLDPQASAA